MSTSRPKALWDFAFLASGETLSKIAGFIAFAYLARILTPQAYGSVEVAVAMLALFSFVVDFGFGPIAARDIIRNPGLSEQYAALIPAARLLLIIFSIPAMCAVAYFMELPRQTMELVWVFAFALIAHAWIQLGILQGLDKMAMVSFAQILRMLTFALGVILFVHNTDDLLRVGFVEIASMTVMATYFAAMQKRLLIPLRLSFNIKELLKLAARSYEMGLSMGFCGLTQYLPTLFMAVFAGAVEVAWFVAAQRIVISVVTYSSAYHFNLFPIVASHLKESREAFLKLAIPSYRVSVWGVIFIALTTVLISKPVCVFIFGQDYANAGLALAILIWVLPFALLSGHAHWALIAIHKQRNVLFSQLAGLMINIVSGLILIPKYGLIGAAISMLASSVMVWLVAHFYANRLVAKTPFIRLLIPPAFLAALVIYFVYEQVGLTGYTMIVGPVVYAVGALLFDKSLISDLHILLKVKNKG